MDCPICLRLGPQGLCSSCADEQIRLLKTRLGQFEAALTRIRDQQEWDRPWVSPKIIANEALGGEGMPSRMRSRSHE